MKNTIIKDIPKNEKDIKDLQRKLFSLDVFWKKGSEEVRNIKDFSNSPKLIFIINENGILSWTTEKYGMLEKTGYQTKTFKEVIK